MPEPTKSSAKRIARRAVLRGAGVTMALPWLESFAPKAASEGTVFPKRFGVVFLGNGVNDEHWGSTGSVADSKRRNSLTRPGP